MSGVVIDGQQWEHCHLCNGWVKFPQNLGYTRSSPEYPYGQHICVSCADHGIRTGSITFDNIIPAPNWRIVEVNHA